MFGHSNLTNHPTSPQKVIKKLGIFQYEVDADDTPWHVKSTLDIVPPTDSLPNFKGHFPKFSGIKVTTMNEHLATFSNAFINIDANEKRCLYAHIH